MSEYVLENDQLKVTVSSHGCEMISVIRKSDNRECMWDANPAAWKRHSPVLFPHIGVYSENQMRYEGTVYQSSQHGFARDMEFELDVHNDHELFMSLHETEDTLRSYPFHFKLTCGYELHGNEVRVIWKVENTNKKEMYFSIGGHPAFACPDGKNSFEGCELQFDTEADAIHYGLLNDDGLVIEGDHQIKLNHHRCQIKNDMFDTSAYVVENSQTNQVSILERGKAFITVRFDAPVFGLWSPAGKNLPFLCIEPWYGRADRDTFSGELKDREWGNQLAAGETFERSYEIVFED